MALAVAPQRQVAPFVLTGAIIGGVLGYALYRRQLGPYGDDYFANISIPLFVGGGAAAGAFVGWLVAPRSAPTRAAVQRARQTSAAPVRRPAEAPFARS